MLETFEALARSLNARPRLRKTLLVGVDGPGGAGKSTFAEGLAVALTALRERAAIVHLDDFYRPAAERLQGPLESRPPAGDYDWERLREQVLQPLAQDQPARYQRYDWPADALAEWHTLPIGGAVIVEGISSLRNELAPFYDFKVWVVSPRPVRLQRGLERDGEAARSRWEEDWMPAEEHYFHRHHPQEQADLWVEGSARPGVDPLVAFLLLERRSG